MSLPPAPRVDPPRPSMWTKRSIEWIKNSNVWFSIRMCCASCRKFIWNGKDASDNLESSQVEQKLNVLSFLKIYRLLIVHEHVDMRIGTRIIILCVEGNAEDLWLWNWKRSVPFDYRNLLWLLLLLKMSMFGVIVAGRLVRTVHHSYFLWMIRFIHNINSNMHILKHENRNLNI